MADNGLKWTIISQHEIQQYLTNATDYGGGYGEMAEKVIEGDMSHVKSYS